MKRFEVPVGTRAAGSLSGKAAVYYNRVRSSLVVVHPSGTETDIGAGGGGGTGDVVGPSASVTGEVALFSGTTGKLLARATGSGLAKLISGVLSTVTTWTSAALTGTANRLASFDGSGNPTTTAIGSSSGTVCAGDDSRLSDARTPTAHQSSHRVGGSDALPTGDATTPGLLKLGASGGAQAYDAGLASLTGADASAGLPYVTAADTWASASLGDLAVSGGSFQATQARGLRETSGPTTLTMAGVENGQALKRSGTNLVGYWPVVLFAAASITEYEGGNVIVALDSAVAVDVVVS